MNNENNLSIVIPVYNEEKVIVETLERVKSALKNCQFKYEVMVINDGSSDQTKTILKNYRDIILISRDTNRGYGFSLKEGMERAKGNWVLIVDADGSYPIEQIPFLIKDCSSHDMVVGERTGQNISIGIFNRLGKFILKLLIFALTSKWIKDINSGFRIFKKELALKYWSLIPDGFSLTTTLTVAAMIERYNIKFIPIDYLKRVGKSKIKPIKEFINFVMLVIKIISYFKPLRFYLPISILFLIASLLRGLRDVLLVNSVGSVAVLLFVVSIHTFFFGIIADLIVNINMRRR